MYSCVNVNFLVFWWHWSLWVFSFHFISGKICYQQEFTRSTLPWAWTKFSYESWRWWNCWYICCQWAWYFTYHHINREHVSITYFFLSSMSSMWHVCVCCDIHSFQATRRIRIHGGTSKGHQQKGRWQSARTIWGDLRIAIFLSFCLGFYKEHEIYM
jgi:hypothetical protein